MLPVKRHNAYSHRVQKISEDHYRLSWTFDTKISGSRLRWPRTITRDTDKRGAMRFAKKWEIDPVCLRETA